MFMIIFIIIKNPSRQYLRRLNRVEKKNLIQFNREAFELFEAFSMSYLKFVLYIIEWQHALPLYN